MGSCQSHSARRKERDLYMVDTKAVPLAKSQTNRNVHSIKSTPRGGKASYAYDLALISPSERTGATDAISPTSMFSPDIANISPIKKENHFDFELVVDENENFSPKDGLEELCSRIVKDTFPEVETEDNHGLDTNDFMTLLTAKEAEFREWEQNDENAIYGPYSPPNSTRKALINNRDFESNPSPNVSPNALQGMMENLTQTNPEVHENYALSKLNNDVFERFGSYQVSSKFDPPTLLAPPKDVNVVAEPSNTYTAVNPSILATFNKMKTHVDEMQQKEKQRRKEEKIMDRRRDIEGYKELWGEYNKIQKRVINENSNTFESPSPMKENEKVSLTDATTWFVDFSALNSAENHSDEARPVDCQEIVEKQGTKNQTNLPFLIESSAFYSRQDTFGQEYYDQRKELVGKQKVGGKAFPSPPGPFDIRDSPPSSQNHHDSDTSENGEKKNMSVSMDLDLGTRSIVSDLGNGSNSSIASESFRAFDNDDYGVLRRYTRRSIESTVPTHTENFNAHFDKQNSNDPIPFVLNSKSLKQNKSSSFSKHMEKNCLPSVYIDDAETGLIRWREFPKSVELDDACNDGSF